MFNLVMLTSEKNENVNKVIMESIPNGYGSHALFKNAASRKTRKLITLPTQSLCSHIVANQSELEIPDLRGDKLLNPKKTLNKNFKI